MVRKKFKWKFGILLYLVFLNVFTKSLPLSEKKLRAPLLSPTDSVVIDESVFLHYSDNLLKHNVQDIVNVVDVADNEETLEENKFNSTDAVIHQLNSSFFRNVRPGQRVSRYAIEITPNGDTFSGVALITVEIDASTREDPVKLHCQDLNIESVEFGIFTVMNPQPCDFNVDDGVLELSPGREALNYMFLIRYNGQIRTDGIGLYRGNYDDKSYLAINFHPTHARRVFPCMDEATVESTIQFTFDNIQQSAIVGNSIINSVDGNKHTFTAMQGPVQRWGFVAHDFVNVNNPIIGTRLFIRSGISGQEAQASVIINAIFSRMEAWTAKPYFEIHQGQNEVVDIFAMPDITKEWNSLSSIAVWEPYVLMPVQHAHTQRKTAIVELAKAISNQWFGYVIYPSNWRYAWINTGLSAHTAYEMAKNFQGDTQDSVNINMNAAFVADVIQESLLRDSYKATDPLETGEDIFEENVIRNRVNGIVKWKAPAIMHMLHMVLGKNEDNEVDIVQAAARSMLNSDALQAYSSLNFYDAVHDVLPPGGMIDNVKEFLEAWVQSANYPVVNVQLWNTGVTLIQETFSYSNIAQVNHRIPISYTTSVNPNFDNIKPTDIMDNNHLHLPLSLREEDWFLCNIQGQGYYRVNYDERLWERIIDALANPDTRDIIHPLNRAALVDDALNLARGGRLSYDIALRLVLTMEHETEYAVWKAFIRNMTFLKKRLEKLVDGDDELDPDIYLRMVRRTIGAVEQEFGFYPDLLTIEDTMTSITRGLVMEHACSAGYQPCIAAAVDFFFDPASSEPAVNPNIPHDIRPAVYCTMMREGDEAARDALLALYEVEPSAYERLVIVRSLACSADEAFSRDLLIQLTTTGGQFGIEERAEYFKALIQSSIANADLALRFIRINTNAIRNMFGGSDRLEEILYVLGENILDADMSSSLGDWILLSNNNLDDSTDMANRASEHAAENLLWNEVHLMPVYEWIDENDAHSIAVSIGLLVACLMVSIYIQ